MQFLKDEFIQENIISKAKQYDFLPIAYNYETVINQVKNEFQDKKLNTQIQISAKF